MFSLQSDGVPSVESYARYDPTLSLDMTLGVTFCVRLMVFYSRGPALTENFFATIAATHQFNFIQMSKNNIRVPLLPGAN